ncbi:MAG: hypothetical protein JNG88_14725 [Phycisphaerales bacterium]|nr:hypothetical protein [Phycisphaerales bacterium]
MKGATQCARRVKSLFKSLRGRLGKVHLPAVGDPIGQLILGVFSRDNPESKAREALDALRGIVVDYNELRVIPPLEIAETVGEYSDIKTKSEDLSRSLNKIFLIEHIVSLDRLTDMSAKDARAYLDRIDGLEPYTHARIRLLGLGKHAIPLDEAMLALARREEIIDGKCTLGEAQDFLERQISDDDALEFFTLLRKHAWSEFGAAVRKGDVERINSVPPDRTSRNMLKLITPDDFAPQSVTAGMDDDGFDEIELEPRATKTSRKPVAKESKRSAGVAAGAAAPKRGSEPRKASASKSPARHRPAERPGSKSSRRSSSRG